MSFKAEFLCYGEKEYATNAVAFATREEAEAYGFNKMYNWTLVNEYRTFESDEPVNYKWEDGVGLVRIPKEDDNG